MSTIVLITGANKGIGFETARQLGKQGYKVLLGARDEARGVAAAKTLQSEGLDVTFVPIDVVDNGSVQTAAALVEKEHGKLDVLINNAGVLAYDNFDPINIKLDRVRFEFEVNFFGAITVTTAFLPLLKKSSAVPRIVNVSSILGSHAAHDDTTSTIYGVLGTGYNGSKAALNMYTQNLALALEKEGVAMKVNSAHPGWVKTDMGGEGAQLDVVEGTETIVFLATLGADGPTGGFFFKKDRLAW